MINRHMKNAQHFKSLEKCKSKLQCSITDHMLSSKISEIKFRGGCGEKRTLDAVGGKVERYSQYAKQYGGFSKN